VKCTRLPNRCTRRASAGRSGPSPTTSSCAPAARTPNTSAAPAACRSCSQTAHPARRLSGTSSGAGRPARPRHWPPWHRQPGEQDFRTPARDLAERRRPGARRPRRILRDPVRKAQNQNGLMRTAGRLSPEHTDYRVASALQHTGSHRAVCHALWPALVAARRTISASSARVPAHVGSRRRRSRLVDLSATSDSGISMSHRRVFGRRMWVELPALLPWFCGGAVRAQGGRGWLALQTRLPPGMMFRAGCARPYRG
jgi:hypothetical protein